MRVAYCMHEGISYAIVVDCAKPENKCQEKVKRNFSKYSIVWVLLESARKTKLRTYVRRLDEIGTAFDSAKTQGQSRFNYYYSITLFLRRNISVVSGEEDLSTSGKHCVDLRSIQN